MPLVFDSLQGIDRSRTESLMSFMLSSLRVERSVRPIVDKCHEGMEKAAKSILYDEVSVGLKGLRYVRAPHMCWGNL